MYFLFAITGVLVKSLTRPARKQVNVCHNGVNFLRRLALHKKKRKPDDSARLDVVEIARVPDMLVSFLVGLRTYQHPGNSDSQHDC